MTQNNLMQRQSDEHLKQKLGNGMYFKLMRHLK